MPSIKYFLFILLLQSYSALQAFPSVGNDSLRTDSYSLRTRGAVERLLRNNPPRLTYNPDLISTDSFPIWRAQMCEAMTALMNHPKYQPKSPQLINRVKRPGYTLEKWESYPLDSVAVPFLVLLPDGVSSRNPAPAALCIPGFSQTKELLAGERIGNYDLDGLPDSTANKNTMALDYVKAGLVAVAVDNPSFGELSDDGHADYIETSRFLLECNWSYLGLSSWQDYVILQWLKSQPYVNPERIIISGFSLGTESMMALGLLDESIFAFVYNDFLCRTHERALVMDARDKNGIRQFPNSLEHLIPGFLLEFDFPDIVAAFAPRYVICTEGGLDRDFDIIKSAYTAVGAANNFEYHHYPKFANPDSRIQTNSLPKGLTRDDFFRLANVDPPAHYFKKELVMSWLKRILNYSDF